MPLVSVVIPLYNKENYIKRAIDSILCQTFTDYEIVVVNDGSTDKSASLIKSYTDPRIRIIDQPNSGASSARNRGIAESKANLISFLDADDEWLPFFLDTVIDLCKKFPDAGLYGTKFILSCNQSIPAACMINENNHIEGRLLNDYFKRMAYGLPTFYSSSVMIRKAVLESIGGFPVEYESGEDLYTWALIALKYQIAWSERICTVYHLNKHNYRKLNDDLPYGLMLERACSGEETSLNLDKAYCLEYLNRMRLLLAARHIRINNINTAKDLIRKTVNTRLYRNYRRRLVILTMIPNLLRNLIYAGKQKVTAKFEHNECG